MGKRKFAVWVLPALLLAVFLLLSDQFEEDTLKVRHKVVDLNKDKFGSLFINTRASEESIKHNLSEELAGEIAPLKEQFKNITQAYVANSQYPAYSKLLHRSDWNLLNPRAFIPHTMAMSESENVLLSIQTPHYIHNRKLELPIEVIVNTKDGSPLPTNVYSVHAKVSQQDLETGLVYLAVSEQSESRVMLKGNIPPGYLMSLNDGQSTIRADIEFLNGWQTESTAQIKLFDAKTELVEIGDAYIDGAHLEIPLSFSVYESGHYQVRANLFDLSSSEPVSHLVGSFRLSDVVEHGLLRVHASALRAKGIEGPYLLKDFDVTRFAGKPGERTTYGASLISEHVVNGYKLTEYNNEQHQDERIANSIEFLERISSIQ